MSKQWRDKLKGSDLAYVQAAMDINEEDSLPGLLVSEKDLYLLVKKLAQQLDNAPHTTFSASGGSISAGNHYTIHSGYQFTDQYINSLFENEAFKEKLRGFIAGN